MRWTAEVEASYKAVAETDVDAADMLAKRAEILATAAGASVVTMAAWEGAAKVAGYTLPKLPTARMTFAELARELNRLVASDPQWVVAEVLLDGNPHYCASVVHDGMGETFTIKTRADLAEARANARLWKATQK
jgi:hypothetical protein